MGAKQPIEEMLYGRFFDEESGENQITTNQQGDIESLPVEVGIRGGKFTGQMFGGSLALASADGGYTPSGNFDTKIPQNRRHEIQLDPQEGPEVVVFANVEVPLSTPDSEILLLFNGTGEGWDVIAQSTRRKLLQKDERKVSKAVEAELNAVRTRVAELEREVASIQSDGVETAAPVSSTQVEDEDGNVELVPIASQFVGGVLEELQE